MEIPTGNSELKILNIKSNDICGEWIPSLSSPILIAHPYIDVTDKKKIGDLPINNPFFNFNEPQLQLVLYNYDVLNQKFNATLGKIKTSAELKNCYLGLSSRIGFEVNKDAPDMHPGICATITLDKKPVGIIGKVHPSVSKDNLFVCELSMTKINVKSKAPKYKEGFKGWGQGSFPKPNLRRRQEIPRKKYRYAYDIQFKRKDQRNLSLRSK